MMICFAKGGIKYSERFLPRRTSIVSSISATMMYVVGILLMISLAGKFCKQGLSSLLYKEMHISGARHVMFANKRGLGDSFVALSSQSPHMDHLRNGALMPLGLCLRLQEVKNTSL